MTWLDREDVRLGISLAIGLLIGAERERSKGGQPHRTVAGVRTFALVSLGGGLGMLLGVDAVVVVSALFVALLAALSYLLGDREDRGLTTEMALLVAFLLGALATREPRLAAGLAVVVTILLAGRGRIHGFVRNVLTEQEMHDGLLLAAAALVILPLAPDQAVGPYGALNPRTLWRLVVLLMALSSAGYLAVRLLGPRAGLPLSGLASGFVSSSATIGAMGTRAVGEPRHRRAAVAGAVLSNLATVAQLAVVVGATSAAVLARLAWPLLVAGMLMVVLGIVAAAAALREPTAEASPQRGRPFDPRLALSFAGVVALVTVGAAAIHDWLGDAGLAVAATLAGFADAHAAAISVAALAAGERVAPAEAIVPVLAGLTANTVTKAVVAAGTGGRRYLAELLPALLALVGGAWLGWWVSERIG